MNAKQIVQQVVSEAIANGSPIVTEIPVLRFKVGETYAQRFMCDYDSIAYFTIKSRTAKTVTIDVHGKEKRRGLYVYCGREQFKPYGSYSMAMVVSAKDLASEV